MTAGPPGVLHGNRTYLLQDADGQILEGHSISAGLDYPGVGPEHSWLRDTGRVELRADHRRRGAGRVPAAHPARGHHPGAGARPMRSPQVIKLAPTMGKDQIIVDEPVRPRRQGRLHGGQDAGHGDLSYDRPHGPHVSPLLTTAEGRPALVTYFMGGDPDYDTVARHHEGAAGGRRRRDRARHAVLRSDGRRPGDPGGGPARAEGRPDAGEDARAWRAPSARATTTTPIVLMGYYNPIYIYGVEALRRAMRWTPASTA